MNVILCCAGGFSTTMLMENMKKVVKNSAKLDESKFSFEAIPVDLLEEKAKIADVVLVGPQISHKEKFISEILNKVDVPYTVIDKDTYGNMDGASVMKMALIAHRKHQISKE